MTQTKASEDEGDVQVSVETPSAWSRKLVITVPAPRVRSARETVVTSISQRVRRPGFRRGHVPRKIVERDYRRDIERETLQRLVDECFRAALTQKSLDPISESQVDVLQYEPDADSDLVFQATFDIRPEVRLNRLGGFRIRRQPVTVADAEVEETLGRLREAHALWKPAERSPLAGDKVAVVLTPLDAEGAEPRRYEFPLGEGQAIPDVESAILTLTPTQVGEFTVAYPADFPDESKRGTSHRIRLSLEGVWAKELPALDDAFAREVSDAASLEELRVRVMERIREEKEAEERRRIQNELLDQILEANPFEVPESMVRRYLDALLSPAGDAPPEAVERARERYRPAALRGIKKMLVIQRVAEEHALHASEEEVLARASTWAERINRPVAELRRELERSGEWKELTRRITEEKVFAHLETLSTIE